jgi:hypothetical protein
MTALFFPDVTHLSGKASRGLRRLCVSGFFVDTLGNHGLTAGGSRSLSNVPDVDKPSGDFLKIWEAAKKFFGCASALP